MDDDRGHCLAPVAAASDVMKQMRLAIALSIGLAAAGCAGTTPVAPDTVTSISQGNLPAPAQSRPDFSGLWSIDADASDDPQKKLKEAMKAMKQAGGGGHGKQGNSGGQRRGGGNGGGRQGHGSAGGMGGGSEMPSGELSALLSASETLEISHVDPALLIVGGNQQSQRLFTDFRGASISAAGGLQQRVTIAGWEGGVLVVETTMNNGIRLVQRYQIDDQTGQLMISSVTRLSDSQSITLRLVYKRLGAGKNQAADKINHTES